MSPRDSASSQCGFAVKSNARFAPCSARTTLPLSSGATGTCSNGMLGTSSSKRWSWESTTFTSSSSPPMRSPSSRMRTISVSRCSASLVRPTSFEPWLSSALSDSTSVSSARRRSSSATISSSGASVYVVAIAALTRSGSSRINRKSSITAPSSSSQGHASRAQESAPLKRGAASAFRFGGEPRSARRATRASPVQRRDRNRRETRQKLRPLAGHGALDAAFDGVVAPGTWLARFLAQDHPRFSRELTPFAMVARLARGNQIVPGVQSAAGAGHDVVDSQIVALPPAILAGVAIADEDFTPRELHPRPRPVDQIDHADHRGRGKDARRRLHDPAVGLQHFRLAVEDEQDRPTDVADVQWFVVLIEYQDSAIHPADASPVSGLPRSPSHQAPAQPHPVAAVDPPGVQTARGD